MTTSIQKDALLSQFSVLAYNDKTFLENSANLPSGWKFVAGEINGPFAAFAFKNEASGEVIVAYRGTDGLNDFAADSKILAGGWDTQFQQGMDFLAQLRSNTRAFPEGYDPSKLLVSGRSLGGAIAQVVAQAYGLDGSTIDPGAAQRIVQTPEFQAAVLAAGLPENGFGIANTFSNHLVVGSTVSGGTGPHLGSVSYIPSLNFTGDQALTTFLIGMVNPVAGIAYAIGMDQFSNKHSSEQVSQAIQLMAGAADAGTVGSNALVLTPKIIGWHNIPETGESTPFYSQTEFEIRNKAGDLQSTVTFSGRGSERQFEVFDAAGELKSTTTLSPSGAVTIQPVRGDSIVVNNFSESQTSQDVSVTTIYRTSDGNVISTGTTTIYEDGSTNETVRYADGHTIRTNADKNGTITSRADIQYFEEYVASIETVTYADGLIVRLSYDRDGNLLSQQEIESGSQTLQNAIDQYGGTLLDALTLVKAIQSGEPLPIVASGLKIANDLSNLNGTPNLDLSGAAYAASGILSLMSLNAALERGDTLGALTAGAQAVTFGATAYANFASHESLSAAVDAGAFGDATGAIGVVSKALPYLSIINSIAHEDYVGAVIGVVALYVPVIGWAYSIYSIVSSLFADEPAIPDPWGNGQFIWDGEGIRYQAAGETGGKEAVENVMNSTLATLNALIERARQQNSGSPLGIIPNRMPSVGYDMSGYRFTDIDPLSGAEKHPSLRFDTSGRPYNAEPGDPASYQSIVEGIVRSALARGAIAPLWEVQTAKRQTDAGDPQAGLTEEARAGRAGQLAAPVSGSTQFFRPVALDLDGDGIETTDKAHGVAFDVDDSGYLKQTAWVKSDDAFLVLDRDYNGQFDSGKELFSNAGVALSRRGLAGMAWVDANYDGRLTADDPVWSELKLWRDLNQDGQQENGEVQTLDALGVTELNYAMSTFTQNGVKKQLGSPDLDADSQGTRVSVVPEGILVQASESGHLSLLVTRIDDHSAVEARRDGVTGYEDTEIIVSSADLLANDSLGGVTGQNLSIREVSNFRHGTGFLDANGFVHFIPEANYAGDAAGFDYVAQAANGQSGLSTVDITLQNVNDAPTLGQVDHTTRAIYGYTPFVYATSEVWIGNGYVSGGNPIYTPYAILRDMEGSETVVYNPSPLLWQAEYHTTPIATEDSGAGRVNGADADDPASSLTYEIVNQPQYGHVSLNADGTFQYTSWKEPDVPSDRIVIAGQYAAYNDGMLYYQGNLPSQAVYPTTDVFQVRITDPHGASTTQSISVPHYGPYLPPTPSGGGGGKKPIAVDLNGNGFEFVNVDDSNVFFDVNGDGWKHRTSWVGKDDGLLAYDIDGNGKIDKPGEIAFTRYKNGAQSDLEGLRAFDSNGDGRFDPADDKWAKFGVWQDANQNGVTDPGEFRTLSEMGIAAVNLTSDGRFQIINRQTIHGMGNMTKADGGEIAIADVTFAYSNETQVPQGDGTTRTVSASPFSPSGEEIVGTDGKDLILGKNGNNIVKGLGSDDVIFEDGGNDIIDAGDGNDLIYAGADDDLVMGGAGDDAIYAGPGNDIVFGGDGHDAIFAENGNDVVFGGAGNDLISGGYGNDVLSGDGGDDQVYGESGNDALFGRDGNDELSGMDGNDRLDGGAGDDLLDGGAGVDEMIGGAGDDTYAVDDIADSVTERLAEGNDTVQTTLDGYALGINVENLTLTGSTNLTGYGNELDNVLTGNRGNNVLVGGAGNDRLDGGLGRDTLIGGVGDDTYAVDNIDDLVIEAAGEGSDTVKAGISHALSANIENLVLTGTSAINATGNELDNQLSGNAGNNVLDGGVGVDLMVGGRGNDTYVVDQTADVVVELADEGVDTVISTVDYALGSHVENLTLAAGSANLTGSGNELANQIIGNAGDNVLDGAAGADTLSGGAGNDAYVVDNQDDRVIEFFGGGIDSVLSSVTFVLPEHVENLTLTGQAAIDGTGNALNNQLLGNAAANVLDGAAGADDIIGGAGDDVYYVDDVADRVTETANEGYDTIRTTISLTAAAHVERLELLANGHINATGNDLNNVLLGNGGDNRLDGGQGADTLIGGAGDDSYIVDDIADAVVEATGEGNDSLISSVTYALSANVENLTLTGSANIDGTGNAMNNILTGNSGRNVIDGGSGIDTMIGGAGDDDYIVDDMSDVVTELAFEGVDTIHTSVSYVLPEHVENLILTGGGNIGAAGNSLDNHLSGHVGDNVISGGAGNDLLEGLAGNDTLDGGQGNDVQIGGAGNDTYLIHLGDGLDQIVDLAGTDSVRFGAGLSLDNIALRITATNGSYKAQVRVLNAGGCEQADQGFDFTIAVDRCGRVISPIERFQFADGSSKTFDDLLIKTRISVGLAWTTTITTGRDDDIIITGSRNALIRSGSGNDTVFVLSGGSTVYGEGGDDYLQGGSGNDTLDGGCGIDVLAGSNGRDTLRDMDGNNAFFGGAQNDQIEAGAGNDFIAGGLHDDTIQAGGGVNVVAFNRGDGSDVLLPNVGASNTLSLGGGIDENDLAFSKIGTDLLLATGGANQIKLKDWYASSGNHTVNNLQVVETLPLSGRGQTSPTGWHVDTFDFKALVQQFDAARTANPKLSQWRLMNGLLDAHLVSSDAAALGGELATRHAAGGGSAISLGVAQNTLQDAHFGNQAQTVGSRFEAAVGDYRLG